jgi:hypothetical protein
LFQEGYGITALLGKQVIDDTSLCLNDPTVETKQHISSNHMDMCRFSGLEYPEYLKMAAAMTFILGTIENGTHTISREPSLARRLFRDISPITESRRVSRGLSIVRDQLRETSPLPETRKEPVTRVSHSIDATTKQSLIDQLYFAKIDERLTAAQGATYRWFLTKPEYTS